MLIFVSSETLRYNTIQTDTSLIPEGYQILIKTISGKTLVIDVQGSVTVEGLKNLLENKTKIPIKFQKLYCNGKSIANNKMTLKEYKIDKHSQIYMSLGLMGGMETN